LLVARIIRLIFASRNANLRLARVLTIPGFLIGRGGRPPRRQRLWRSLKIKYLHRPTLRGRSCRFCRDLHERREREMNLMNLNELVKVTSSLP